MEGRSVTLVSGGGNERIVGRSVGKEPDSSVSRWSPLTTVLAMACIASGRLCARAEKLCQFGHFAQLRREVTTTTCAKSRLAVGRTCGALLQRCQSKANTPDCRIGLARATSTMQTQMPGSRSDYQIDPYRVIEDDLKDLFENIRKELINATTQKDLHPLVVYYMDGQGKALRPMLSILMARAINYHKGSDVLSYSQQRIAMISEMVHVASLLHDDVIDQSNFRRGKPSVNIVWSQKKVAVAGDFILAVACMILARIQNDDVTITMNQIITDLVQGEFMQLGSKETENERFAHYFSKTYLKTGSLMANCTKSVALLAEVDDHLIEMAYQYGRNVGLAFQLVDDLLDFVASAEAIGKPAAADLKLGLATAPVLFACERYPELNAMIMRRFQEPGDVEKAFELVHKSNGLEQTKFMAKKHCVEATRILQSFVKSPYQKALLVLVDLVLNRMK
ncbi:PREDICTED: decaprenyl-diphosphate synthase subunit 1 [Dinoponera quadriceps]|uniref:All trans-polyprenyl-diphosphate synthase PDSS1 n=1 Tax=Dinoponera quadriceps TaxID=609295 RepID=A0A6P3WPE4_DINQU|nr:PREDICTED: decaprenyl-diphosphate synthase subunit 1 [Dinoponera quadriceps]